MFHPNLLDASTGDLQQLPAVAIPRKDDRYRHTYPHTDSGIPFSLQKANRLSSTRFSSETSTNAYERARLTR